MGKKRKESVNKSRIWNHRHNRFFCRMPSATFKLQKSQKSLFPYSPFPYLKPTGTICTPIYQCSARTHCVWQKQERRGGQHWQEQHGVFRAQHPAPRHCANSEKRGCCKNCHKIWLQTQVSITEWFPPLPWTHNRWTSFLPLPQGTQPPCVLQGTSKMKIHGAARISHSRRW